MYGGSARPHPVLSFRPLLLALSLVSAGLVSLAPPCHADMILGPEVRLSADLPDFSMDPTLVSTPSGADYLVWEDGHPSADYEVFLSRWTGTSWLSQEQVTSSPGRSLNPNVASDELGNLHLVWADTRDGNQEIYYKTGVPGNWGADQRLSDNPAVSGQPVVIAGAGAVYVFWDDARDGVNQIYYRKKTSSGWSPEAALTNNAFAAFGCSAAINPDGHVLVLWNKQGDETAMVYESFWNGSSWTEGPLLDDYSASHPAVIWDPAGTFTVIIRSYRDGNGELYEATGDGVSWSAWTRLTSSTGDSDFADMCTDPSGDLQVVWFDTRTGHEESFIKTRDSGTGTWSADQQVSSGGSAQYPTVACDGNGTIQVAYWDGREGHAEIYGRHTDIPGNAEEVSTGSRLALAWPNPFRETLWFRSPFDAGGDVRLELIDPTGRLVLERILPGNGATPVKLNLSGGSSSDVGPGVYFYRAVGAGGTVGGRIVRLP